MIHEELLHICPLDGLVMPSPRGPHEVAAAHAVMQMCNENPGLWQVVFRLRSVFGWSVTLDTLDELTKP